MSSEPIFLVTGAAGFVGEHLVRHLKSEDIKVRAMVRKPAQAEALEGLADEIVFADLADPDSLSEAVAGVAGIYHLASIFRQEGLPDETFYDINAEGTRRIFAAAIAASVPRIIHCSTNGVHSDIDHPPATEEYPFKPADIYQETKLAGEKIAFEYYADGRMAGVVLRPTMIWGPGDDRTLKMFRMIQKGRFFFVGNGETLHHWVDVRDLAVAFQQAMESDINNEAFLIGGEDYVSLRTIANEIAKQLQTSKPTLHLPVGPMMLIAHATEIVCKPLGIEPPIFRRRVGFFLKNRAYDISKAKRLLKYQPKQRLEGEITDIIASYRSNGKLAQDEDDLKNN